MRIVGFIAMSVVITLGFLVHCFVWMDKYDEKAAYRQLKKAWIK